MKRNIVLGSALIALASCGGAPVVEESLAPEKLLVVVDVQRDFFSPEGALYVSGSEQLPASIAALAEGYDAVIFTLDWHPGNHCSFAPQGGPWPVHCVAYTQGAGLADEFAPILAGGRCALFFKGQDPASEQYGAFESLEAYDTVRAWLSSAREIDVCGIAGDYCVKASAENLLKQAPARPSAPSPPDMGWISARSGLGIIVLWTRECYGLCQEWSSLLNKN